MEAIWRQYGCRRKGASGCVLLPAEGSRKHCLVLVESRDYESYVADTSRGAENKAYSQRHIMLRKVTMKNYRMAVWLFCKQFNKPDREIQRSDGKLLQMKR